MGPDLHEEKATVNCVICGGGDVHAGTATVTLEREGMTLVIKGVPARVCANCGEEYVDETTSVRLLKMAEEAAQAGIQVDVREYVAA
ncbi:MAG: type II toxin-antitoxin system MqsA family antitoxin [Actinomycetota bacterium]